VSGPIGSAYPGNFVTLILGCFFAIISTRSALSAYKRRRENASLQNWEADLGLSIVTLLAFVFALYAVWVHW
jgi:hypothetical protein